MGLLADVFDKITQVAHGESSFVIFSIALLVASVSSVLWHIGRQLFFKPKHEPPEVFSWLPFIGHTISYGMDPPNFFAAQRKKYGDTFTFVILGRRWTVCVGVSGNNLVLNANKAQVNAEEIYGPLATPVFGEGVVYDCPLSKLMEQKKMVKFGLSTQAFQSYIPIMTNELMNMLANDPIFKGQQSGTFNVTEKIAQLTLYTASASLQGPEVRNKFDDSFAALFCDLDEGFSPVNFLFPHFPFPHNRKRDRAQKIMAQTYMDIIRARRTAGEKSTSLDMTNHLMDCSWVDGEKTTDKEVAHMMIALLMAGQHSSSATLSWMLLNLANKPEIQDLLYAEQMKAVGDSKTPLAFEHLAQLPLHQAVVKETLRLHAPIHTILRIVKQPLAVPNTNFVLPKDRIILSSPSVTAQADEHFVNAADWDPERWANMKQSDVDEEKTDYGYGTVSKGARSPYLPFGSGIHRCIGEQFANLQLTVLLFGFVRNLKWNFPQGQKLPKTDYSSLFSRPFNPALITWERRELAK